MLDMFELLGKVEVIAEDGIGFCITRQCIEEEFGGSEKKMLKAIPTPDYEHRIYKDNVTDNYMVMRPGPGHRYWGFASGFQRIR